MGLDFILKGIILYKYKNSVFSIIETYYLIFCYTTCFLLPTGKKGNTMAFPVVQESLLK